MKAGWSSLYKRIMSKKRKNTKKTKKTHISIILDRTGSMDVIREDTIGGFNSFLKEQQALPDEASLSLVQFDSQDPYEVVHHFEPLRGIPELKFETYVPRASTPLLDAMGRGINDLEASLAKMKSSKRPDQIVMVIITDGHENSSREFNRQQVMKMIKAKKKEDWQFVFLSADLDSIEDALDYGFSHDSTMAYMKSKHGTDKMWKSSSKALSRYRTMACAKVYFDAEDRADEPQAK